jgi:hypothetical protein
MKKQYVLKEDGQMMPNFRHRRIRKRIPVGKLIIAQRITNFPPPNENLNLNNTIPFTFHTIFWRKF